MTGFEEARNLLAQFKGDSYRCGADALTQVGPIVTGFGTRAALVRGTFAQSEEGVQTIRKSLAQEGVYLGAEIRGARPNAPKDDVIRIASQLREARPDVVISFGGGSTIDATKAASVLSVLGGDAGDYFGLSQVTEALHRSERTLTPHVAIQTLTPS